MVRAAVWLPVTGPALETLERARRRAQRRGGGPIFPLHLTLLSGIETTPEGGAEKLRSLAARLSPFAVKLGRIDWREERYRCLFVSAEPGTALTAAQRLACEIFAAHPSGPFEPHVSLLYGDIGDELKKQIAAELGGRLDLVLTADSVQLVEASAQRPVEEWRTLSERALGAAAP
jgi:2'-5' RNA ligase